MVSTHKRRTRVAVLPIAVVLIAGIALTFVAFVALRNRELSGITAMFERDARDRVAAIQHTTDESAEILEHLRALRESSESVSRDEFDTFANNLLGKLAGTQALEWIPRVPHAERPAYEQAAEADGLSGFRITERSPEGEMVPANVRDEYFPVYYVVPLEGNEAAVGFDLGSNEARLGALDLARDRGEMVATERITLVQETGQQHGFLLFLPIYADGSETSTSEGRSDALEGFYLGVFRVGDLVEAALGTLAPGGIDIDVVDASAPEESRFLYHHVSRPSSPGEASTDANEGELTFVGQIDVGGREWSIECRSIGGYVSAKRQPTTWWVLVSGLLLAALLSAYLVSAARQRAREVARLSGAMRMSEERFRTLVDNANDGIYIRDETGTITYANKRFADIHGRPLDEIVGSKVADLLHDDDRESLEQKGVWEQLKAGMSVKAKSRIVRPSGEVRYTDMSAVPILQEGETVQVFGIVRDITEIEKTAQLRTQFFSNVSHELRTPLTSIVGYADLILRGAGSDISEEQEEFLRIIADNAAKLTHLVNDVLDVERIESREMSFELRPVRLDDILEEAVQSLRAEAAAKELTLRPAAPTGLVVAADPDHLGRLFANLISNAVKYTLAGTVEVRAEERGGMALIEVEDTGIGMTEDEVRQLFRRFFRADNPHVRAVAGTGLGLSIAKAIVDRHHGTIRVDSILDVGTTFRITLPLATQGGLQPEQGM